jgi:hypothetical protein
MADTAPETATITLAEPIRRGEQTIDAIVLTKPRGGALRGLSLQDLLRTDVVALLTLIPRISNPPLTVPEADNLGADDLAEIGGVVRGFYVGDGAQDDDRDDRGIRAEDLIADIAAIFHWPLAEIEALTLTDLIFWRGKALDRWNSMWGSQEKV